MAEIGMNQSLEPVWNTNMLHKVRKSRMRTFKSNRNSDAHYTPKLDISWVFKSQHDQ